MRFLLQLTSVRPNQRVSFNYQYPLAAAIYKIIERADEAYANFLHEDGYRHGGKTFKFFTFSDLQTPFKQQDGKMLMTTNNASFTICFQIPDAAENFIKGIFINQKIDIADSPDNASFIVNQVTAAQNPIFTDNKTVLLQPLSPIVAGRNNKRGYDDYVSPEEPDFCSLLIINLISKYGALYPSTELELAALHTMITLKIEYFNHPPRSRLITIKNGTPEETKVRGFDKFRLSIQAPAPLLTLALNAGLGMHNAMGMGCVAIV